MRHQRQHDHQCRSSNVKWERQCTFTNRSTGSFPSEILALLLEIEATNEMIQNLIEPSDKFIHRLFFARAFRSGTRFTSASCSNLYCAVDRTAAHFRSRFNTSCQLLEAACHASWAVPLSWPGCRVDVRCLHKLSAGQWQAVKNYNVLLHHPLKTREAFAPTFRLSGKPYIQTSVPHTYQFHLHALW